MTSVNGEGPDDERAAEPQQAKVQLARPTRVQPSRSNDGWSRNLTALDGGALRRSPPVQTSGGISVFLAGRVGLVRAGLRSLLDGEDDITVAGEASSGEQALALVRKTRPDVVLMDLRLPGLGGLAATRRILGDPNLSATKVVILTADEREEDLFGALRSGASGFVLLDAEPVELLRAVRVVAGGGAQLSPWAAHRLVEEFAHCPDPPLPYPEQFEELTARERDIVSLVALGLTNSEIAERLVISPATAKTHVSRAMLKLGVRDRAKLVALAHQTGFVQHRIARDRSVLHLAGTQKG
jgi:DNA-binding NarL/FixJ family response regulator